MGMNLSLSRWPAYGAACALLAASATSNGLFGASLGNSTLAIAVWVLASLASDVLKSAAPVYLRTAVTERDFITGFAAVVVVAITVVYSGVAAVGFVAQSRDATSSERQANTDAHGRAMTAYKAAQAKLKTLGTARPSGELKADIAGIDALPGIMIGGVPCGGVANGKVTRTHCPQRALLVAELAKSEAIAATQQASISARTTLDSLPAPKKADPQGEAIVAYLALAGVTASVDDLQPILIGIAALLVELGSLLGFALATGGNSQLSIKGDYDSPKTAVQKSKLNQNRVLADISAVSKGARGRPASVSKEETAKRILDTLKAHGGRSDKSVRGLAVLIGGKRGTTYNALTTLVAAGVIARDAGGLVLVS